MQQEHNWGRMLKHFRLKAGYETLDMFADALAEKCILDISTLSRYENNKERIPKDRQRHIELLEVLITGKGIESSQEANNWLALGNMGYLTEKELARLFPHEVYSNSQSLPTHISTPTPPDPVKPPFNPPWKILESIPPKTRRRVLLAILLLFLLCISPSELSYLFTPVQYLRQDHEERFEPMSAGYHKLMVLVPEGASVKVTLCYKHLYNPNQDYSCWIVHRPLEPQSDRHILSIMAGSDDVGFRITFSEVTPGINERAVQYLYEIDRSGM